MEKNLLYHGSNTEVIYPEIRKSRFTKDFSWVFYCTSNYNQAYKWADKKTGNGFISIYSYVEDSSLNILKFDEMTDEWLDFIGKCRGGFIHSYDIVEGPMADDTIWNFVNDFLAGNISRKAFWAYAEFKHPMHQISFHTLKALNCLNFERSEKIYDSQRKG